jgi:hypothetical protein
MPVWGGVVVKALSYYWEGPVIDPRWCHCGFFSLAISCAWGRLSHLKMSTLIILAVKTVSA